MGKCYTKFGFTDAECSCAHGDGAPPSHCGTAWYDWNCVKNGQNEFIDSGCTKCEGNNHGPCPSTVSLEGECGACLNAESNKCYTKFGFTDAECSCANNDGAPPAHCGTQWYDWNCVKNGKNGFIDSQCTSCVGNNQGPCPSGWKQVGEGCCSNMQGIPASVKIYDGKPTSECLDHCQGLGAGLAVVFPNLAWCTCLANNF